MIWYVKDNRPLDKQSVMSIGPQFAVCANYDAMCQVLQGLRLK
jgi:hypothetical protein